MKNLTASDLSYTRDNLQRMLMLQRGIIVQKMNSIPEEEQDKFPRSHAMRFLYSTKGLLLTQIIFKQVIRNHPRKLAAMKILGKLLLKDVTSKN